MPKQLMKTLATAWAKKANAGSVVCANDQFKGSIDALKSSITGRFANSHIRALVAEDNAVNQTVAVRMLARLGVQADVAGNGREASNGANATLRCRIHGLSDAEMDGYEATEETRRFEGPDRPLTIIALTAGATSVRREECLAAGIDDFIAKPISLNDLILVLQKIAILHPAPAI